MRQTVLSVWCAQECRFVVEFRSGSLIILHLRNAEQPQKMKEGLLYMNNMVTLADGTQQAVSGIRGNTGKTGRNDREKNG